MDMPPHGRCSLLLRACADGKSATDSSLAFCVVIDLVAQYILSDKELAMRNTGQILPGSTRMCGM